MFRAHTSTFSTLLASALVISYINMAGAAFAADAKGNYSVRGIGAMACSDVVQIAKTSGPQLIAIVAWSDGVLTATNRFEKGVVDAVPYNEPPGLLTNLAVNLCTNNPQMIYDTAVRTVLGILKPVALRQIAPPLVAAVGDGAVSTRAETLKLTQAKLIKLKLMKGPVSGEFSESMSVALREYQKQRKLTENGLPDAATVFALLLQ